LGLRVAELKKLGMVPEKVKDQVTFFIELEAKIQDILDLGAKGEHLGRLTYRQDVFNAIYNVLMISQHLKLIAVSGDKYSREKLMNTKDKLMEFRETANVLDTTRVDSGAKKRADGGYAKGSGSSGTGSGSVSGGGGVSHVQATPSSLTVSDCRICEWLDGPGRTQLHRGKPFADLNNLFINHHSKYFYG
jgi:hypothetical protein